MSQIILIIIAVILGQIVYRVWIAPSRKSSGKLGSGGQKVQLSTVLDKLNSWNYEVTLSDMDGNPLVHGVIVPPNTQEMLTAGYGVLANHKATQNLNNILKEMKINGTVIAPHGVLVQFVVDLTGQAAFTQLNDKALTEKLLKMQQEQRDITPKIILTSDGAEIVGSREDEKIFNDMWNKARTKTNQVQ